MSNINKPGEASQMGATNRRRGGRNAARAGAYARISKWLEENKKSRLSEAEKTELFITRMFGHPPERKD